VGHVFLSLYAFVVLYALVQRTRMLISPLSDQEGNKLMFLSEWREFPSAPFLAKKKKDLMTGGVSMLLKSRASLTCFRTCFLPGRAKDLSAPSTSLVLSLYGFQCT